MLRSAGYNQGLTLRNTGPHPRYHFHGFAGNPLSGDGKFFDRSGMGNDFVRGSALSVAQMGSVPGYVATVNPDTGMTDGVLRGPNLNLDYNAGEKLVLFWLGVCNAEAAAAGFMGDGGSPGGTYPGLRIRANAGGSVQFALYDSVATAGTFSGTPAASPFDGQLRSYGLVLDGQAKKYGQWVDEADQHGGYISFGAGAAFDTRNSNTFNVGSSMPNAAVSTDGIQVYTRALHILRFSAADVVPTAAQITTAFQALRRNPGKPLLGSAFTL